MSFLLNLTCVNKSRCTILPQLWLNNLFNIPPSSNNENQQYFHDLFSTQINILDCKIKLPRRNAWIGHPFYFEILKSFHKIISQLPISAINILSIPIWFNSALNTKFDVTLSRAGFNYLKDFFPEGRLIDLQQNRPQLVQNKIRKLMGILNKIPERWLNCVESSQGLNTVVSPRQVVSYKNTDYFMQNLGSDKLYNLLISNLVKLPVGVSRWREIVDLPDQQLKTAFTFARLYLSVFDQVFQYQIVTQILPTGKYLHRYQIRDSDQCTRCLQCVDTVYHSTWQCSRLTSYISAGLEFVQRNTHVDNITVNNYLFGYGGSENAALNHVLLELKKHLFYNWSENTNIDAFCEHFASILRSLIIKENIIALTNMTNLMINGKFSQTFMITGDPICL